MDPTSANDYKAEYDTWFKSYSIEKARWIENSEDAWEQVQKLDPRLVWTEHSTCEDNQVTPGAHNFAGSCCWETFGWYHSEIPWQDEDEYVRASVYLPCGECNKGGEEDEGDPECASCDGEGYVHHYFD